MQKDAEGVELDAERAAMASRGLKALMPLNGRPFLDYIVDSLLRAGLGRLCFVIAPDGDVLRHHARRIARESGAVVECAVQEEPLGTANAVLAAEAFAAGEPFVMCNGDNLYPDVALEGLAAREDDDCWLAGFARTSLIRDGNIAAERVRHFAVVKAEQDGRLLHIVEKPERPEEFLMDGEVWVSMNLYRFTPAIFDACRAVAPDPVRGELELTSAVAQMVDSDPNCFKVLFCRGGILDLTSRADIPAAEARLRGRRLCF